MFRASPDSSQIDLLSNIEQFLRECDQVKLNDLNAWHNVFLDQVTKRIDEECFTELFDEAFEGLTSDQAKRLGVVGEKLRMDSTLMGSNLATCTRLQLIIGCLQAFYKSLTDEQKVHLAEAGRERLDRLCTKRPSQIMSTPVRIEFEGAL